MTSSLMPLIVSSPAKAASKSMPVYLTQTRNTTANNELLSYSSYRNKTLFLSNDVHIFLQYLRDNLGHVVIT